MYVVCFYIQYIYCIITHLFRLPDVDAKYIISKYYGFKNISLLSETLF